VRRVGGWLAGGPNPCCAPPAALLAARAETPPPPGSLACDVSPASPNAADRRARAARPLHLSQSTAGLTQLRAPCLRPTGSPCSSFQGGIC
jgi:hypothetical protein